MPEAGLPRRHFAAQARRYAARLRGEALSAAVERCLAAGRDETGGVILGRYNEAHDCAEIEELCAPPPGSQATRTGFFRGTAGLEEFLRRRWRDGLYYLGEWHSHPLAAPEPSATDIHQIQLIAGEPRYRCPEPLLIILGADPRKQVRLGVYVCPRGGTLVQLGERTGAGPR